MYTYYVVGSQAAQIATHILQFIFLSDGGFRFPVAHFPTAQCPPSTLYFKFWVGALLMKQGGFSCCFYELFIIYTSLMLYIFIYNYN